MEVASVDPEAGSRIENRDLREGGNHFMFMENPDKFNRIVRDFMG
jgi:pimeloyl-ACP methyl ester carboxylesterase